MSKKIQVVQLKSTIEDMLKEYGEDVIKAVPKAMQEVLTESTNELKSAGSFKGKKYRRSWTFDMLKIGERVEGTVYNEKHYRLTHLLEFGHVKQNGGRTRAFKHIEPINNEAQENFEKKIVQYIERGGV